MSYKQVVVSTTTSPVVGQYGSIEIHLIRPSQPLSLLIPK